MPSEASIRRRCKQSDAAARVRVQFLPDAEEPFDLELSCLVEERKASSTSSRSRPMRSATWSVVVVADDDGVDKQPVDCLLARNATLRTCTITESELKFAFNNDLAALARLRGFGFLKTKRLVLLRVSVPDGRGSHDRLSGHGSHYAGICTVVAPFRAVFRHCIFDACPA